MIEQADSYGRVERDWVRAVTESITGVRYGQTKTISAAKPDGQAGTFDVREDLDRYSLYLTLSTSGTIVHRVQTTERWIDFMPPL